MKVFHAIEENNLERGGKRCVAIKEVQKTGLSAEDIDQYKKEIAIMRWFNERRKTHPREADHIVTMFAVYV